MKLLIVCLAAFLIGWIGTGLALNATAQEAVKNAPVATPTPAPKLDEKKAPDNIAVTEARRDKVKLLQLEDENFQLKKQALLNKLTESPEWAKLDTPHKEIGQKLQAELVSALKLAGVEEKDFQLYEYDREAMVFKKKVVTPPVKP